MDVVSVDLGYGFTKGMTVSSRVLFPSVVSMGFERRLQGRYLEGSSSAKYEVVSDGQRYFVGDLALQHGTAPTRAFEENRVDHFATKVLLGTAVVLLTEESSPYLATG